MRSMRSSRGFSLIELVVVIVLMGLMAAVSANIISDSMQTAYTVTNNQTSGSEARYAAERITREVREAAYGSSGGYSISAMTANTFTFTKQDGTVVSIAYASNALTLRYTPGAATAQTLATGVTAFSFSYLDQLGATTTDKEDLRFVTITMTVTNTKTGATDSIRTRIFLRNAQYLT